MSLPLGEIVVREAVVKFKSGFEVEDVCTTAEDGILTRKWSWPWNQLSYHDTSSSSSSLVHTRYLFIMKKKKKRIFCCCLVALKNECIYLHYDYLYLLKQNKSVVSNACSAMPTNRLALHSRCGTIVLLLH